MGSTNERRRYIVTPSLTGWAPYPELSLVILGMCCVLCPVLRSTSNLCQHRKDVFQDLFQPSKPTTDHTSHSESIELIHRNSWGFSIAGLIIDLHPNQWETSLQSNAVSHWLGVNLESALYSILDSMSVSSIICVLFANCKLVISSISLCSGQIMFITLVVKYLFPLFTTRVTVTGIVDGYYWIVYIRYLYRIISNSIRDIFDNIHKWFPIQPLQVIYSTFNCFYIWERTGHTGMIDIGYRSISTWSILWENITQTTFTQRNSINAAFYL